MTLTCLSLWVILSSLFSFLNRILFEHSLFCSFLWRPTKFQGRLLSSKGAAQNSKGILQGCVLRWLSTFSAQHAAPNLHFRVARQNVCLFRTSNSKYVRISKPMALLETVEYFDLKLSQNCFAELIELRSLHTQKTN